jgi:hypothetical protein
MISTSTAADTNINILAQVSNFQPKKGVAGSDRQRLNKWRIKVGSKPPLIRASYQNTAGIRI